MRPSCAAPSSMASSSLSPSAGGGSCGAAPNFHGGEVDEEAGTIAPVGPLIDAGEPG